ncbi:amino acid permease [Patescibacteria group bacterium]|nr:amino acid permease [Patescibacteria group bacterium]
MKFLRALAVFLGTIIGVGIFGLPFVASKSGFWIVVGYFAVMAMVTIIMNLIYGSVIMGTEKIHRLPGYVQEYLGPKWKNFSFLVVAFGIIGSLLAYLIIGGQFLFSCLSPFLGGNILLYTLIFFSVGAFLVLKGIKSISGVELILLGVLLVILGLFFVKAFPYINVENFKAINLEYLILPYGIILFSLGGGSVIPELKEILDNKPKLLKSVIISGILITVMIYLFFIYIIQGASLVVSKDAISGLGSVLGDNVIKLGFLFGVIACFTSFLTLALTLKKVLWYDFKFNKNVAWFLTCFVPLGLFLLGFRKFIEVISFTGAIFFGIEGIILILLYKKYLKIKLSKEINPLFYLLFGVFILGIILSIFFFM